MTPDSPIVKRAKKVVDAGMNIPLAQLTESIQTNEKLDALLAKETIEIPLFPELPEFPTEISISNLPEVQKVEVLNFPEQKAPIVNIEAPKAPVVNVEAPIVELNNEEVIAELKNISEILSKEVETIEKTEIIDKDGKPVDFKKLFENLTDRISHIKVGGSGGGGSFPTQSQYDLATLAANYASKVDTLSTAGVIYIGSASIGSLSSAPVWQISKVDTTGSPVDIVTTWADANASFDNVWDDRLSLSYS